MKKTTLLCALTLFTAVAASGCGSSEMQTINGGDTTADIGTPATVSPSPTKGSDEVITPTEPTGDTATTDPVDTGTTTTPPDDTNGGSGLNVCDATHPPPCVIVDPLPPTGGRGLIVGHLPDETVLADPTTPPDSGSSGGGGYNGGHTIGCYHDDPNTSERMIVPGTTVGGKGDFQNMNDCSIL